MFAQQAQPYQPPVISLGEEYTDDNLPASYIDLDDDQEYVEEYVEENDDYDDDEDSDSPISPDSPPSPTASHSAFGFPPPPSSLWHIEHARLLNIHTAVLDNERASRNRELRLESEVARIKKDLAKLKQARAQAHDPNVAGPNVNMASASTSSLQSGRESAPHRAPGPRGPRPRPQDRSPGNRVPTQSSHNEAAETAAASRIPLAPPMLGKFEFELDQEDDNTTETVETVLSNHLTQARSARAQERHNRKKEYERIRELSVLLTLGSEVRKWEERLAWSRFQASTASDDSTLDTTSKSMEMDMDPDPRGKRLSRSFSLPSRSSSIDPSDDRTTTSNNSNDDNTNSKRSGPPSPALPSLASSPLWRVSAEMILRRRSLSERPRRTPVLSTSVTAGTALHVTREQKEHVNSVSCTPAPLSSTSSANGSTSGASSPTSGKRYSIPPPITIPSNSDFCTSNLLPVVTPVLSKTAPAKPSALKWAYTADDLARELESEMAELRKVQGQEDAMDVDSSSDSESDDSGKSSSEGCSSSSSQDAPVERRGRARFSWRKSLPKEGNLSSNNNGGGAQPMVIDP